MQKRGQAATEFLTTYGWAILILAIVIALIISLRIFSPRIENTCIGSDPISCSDVKFSASTGINIILTASGVSTEENKETLVTKLKVNKPILSNCEVIKPPSSRTSPILSDNTPAVISCGNWDNPLTLKEGNKFSGTATIEYVLPGGDLANPYTSKVIFSGTVEE